MRVAFVVWRFPKLSETFILNQITGLIDRGHDVDIYADEVGETDQIQPAVEQYKLLQRTYYIGLLPEQRLPRLIKGLALLTTNLSKHPQALLRSLNIFKYGKQAASLRLLYAAAPFLGKKPYDIIHCQFGELGLRCMWLNSLGVSHAKLVTSFRGYDITRYLHQFGEDVYSELFKRGDLLLPNCDYFKQSLIRIGCDEGKIAVLRSGIDCSTFTFQPRSPPADGSIRIVTVGRLTEKKGIEYGIRAIANLIQTHPYVEYTVVGDGALRQSLQQLAVDLGVSDRVHLVGWKPQQEIVAILDRAHLFLAPNITAKDGDQDGPTNVLKEALAMGLPAVGTRQGAIPEVVQDGVSGFLVPERDPDALAEKLRYLLNNSDLWLSMGQAGRAYVEATYDIDHLNDRLVDIYCSLIRNHSPVDSSNS